MDDLPTDSKSALEEAKKLAKTNPLIKTYLEKPLKAQTTRFTKQKQKYGEEQRKLSEIFHEPPSPFTLVIDNGENKAKTTLHLPPSHHNPYQKTLNEQLGERKMALQRILSTKLDDSDEKTIMDSSETSEQPQTSSKPLVSTTQPNPTTKNSATDQTTKQKRRGRPPKQPSLRYYQELEARKAKTSTTGSSTSDANPDSITSDATTHPSQTEDAQTQNPTQSTFDASNHPPQTPPYQTEDQQYMDAIDATEIPILASPTSITSVYEPTSVCRDGRDGVVAEEDAQKVPHTPSVSSFDEAQKVPHTTTISASDDGEKVSRQKVSRTGKRKKKVSQPLSTTTHFDETGKSILTSVPVIMGNRTLTSNCSIKLVSVYSFSLTSAQIDQLLYYQDELNLTHAELTALNLLKSMETDENARKQYWKLQETLLRSEKHSTPVATNNSTLLETKMAQAEEAIFGEIIDKPVDNESAI